jgi:tRNA pseudouridine55 synthase
MNTGKVGHCGTLDPFASGLLIALTGAATRTASLFTGLEKTYRAKMLLGSETDTLDPEGVVVNTTPVPKLSDLESVIPSFTGTIEQTPPAYSAIKINGQRSYDLARRGQVPEMKSRTVTIRQLILTSWDPPVISFDVICSSGTYIRSLARDIAAAAGSCGSLLELERVSIGPFCLNESVFPQDFDPVKDLHPVGDPLSRVVHSVTLVVEDPVDIIRLFNGQTIFLKDRTDIFAAGTYILVNNSHGKLVSLLLREESGTRILFVLTNLR